MHTHTRPTQPAMTSPAVWLTAPMWASALASATRRTRLAHAVAQRTCICGPPCIMLLKECACTPCSSFSFSYIPAIPRCHRRQRRRTGTPQCLTCRGPSMCWTFCLFKMQEICPLKRFIFTSKCTKMRLVAGLCRFSRTCWGSLTLPRSPSWVKGERKDTLSFLSLLLFDINLI